MAAEDIEQPPAPAMNDPWAPQPPSNVTVMPCPVDPIHQLISSDKYIESLGMPNSVGSDTFWRIGGVAISERSNDTMTFTPPILFDH